MNERPRERISSLTGALLIGASGAFDLLQLVLSFTIVIPIVGLGTALLAWFVGWFAILIVGGTLWLLVGAAILRRPLLYMAAAAIGESIPLANAMAWNTLAIWRTVHHIQKEDRQKIKEWEVAQAKGQEPDAALGQRA